MAILHSINKAVKLLFYLFKSSFFATSVKKYYRLIAECADNANNLDIFCIFAAAKGAACFGVFLNQRIRDNGGRCLLRLLCLFIFEDSNNMAGFLKILISYCLNLFICPDMLLAFISI